MSNEVIHKFYDQLSPANQEIVAMLVRNLADKEGIEAVEVTNVINLHEVIPLWTSQLKFSNLADGTIEMYRHHVTALIDEYASPTETDIRTFLNSLLTERKMKSGTIGVYVNAIHGFFKYAYENHLYNANPALKIKIPTRRYIPKQPPTEEDVNQFLAVIDNLDHLMMMLVFMNTGVRVSELCTIELSAIDLDQRRISIIGKGRKQRYVYIPAGLFQYLAPYVEHLRQQRQHYLFITHRKHAQTEHAIRQYPGRVIKKYCKKAGVKPFSPHQLRHFFATYVLSRGGDVKAVSELLGHADITITLKIYHHVSERSIRDTVERLSPAAQEVLRLPMLGHRGTIQLVEPYTRSVKFKDSLKLYESVVS